MFKARHSLPSADWQSDFGFRENSRWRIFLAAPEDKEAKQ
jgi:hypothetical protein